jgi:hypothetical protein
MGTEPPSLRSGGVSEEKSHDGVMADIKLCGSKVGSEVTPTIASRGAVPDTDRGSFAGSADGSSSRSASNASSDDEGRSQKRQLSPADARRLLL